MSRWWRAYDDALHNPKVQGLPPALFKFWFNVLCAASKNEGVIPPLDDLKTMLKARLDHVEAHLNELIKRGLVDETDGKLHPHNWDERQYKSDSSAERTRTWRNNKRQQRDVTPAVTVTPPDTDTDTDTDKTLVQIEHLNGREPKGQARKKPDLDPGFLEFYLAYPRRQSKQDAIKAYAQVRKSGVSHESIMAGLERAKRSDRRFREMQFTPHPGRWLRAGGFEDDTGSSTSQQDLERMLLA
jgi:hypothetical protein